MRQPSTIKIEEGDLTKTLKTSHLRSGLALVVSLKFHQNLSRKKKNFSSYSPLASFSCLLFPNEYFTTCRSPSISIRVAYVEQLSRWALTSKLNAKGEARCKSQYMYRYIRCLFEQLRTYSRREIILKLWIDLTSFQIKRIKIELKAGPVLIGRQAQYSSQNYA